MRRPAPAKRAGQNGGPWRRHGFELVDEEFDHVVSLIPSCGQWSRTLVFLHGCGDSAVWTLRELAPYEKLRCAGLDPTELKLTFPFAPMRSRQRSWFDYWSERGPDEEDDVDTVQVAEERRRLHRLLDLEVSKLDNDPSRLFVGGFSQGCQMAWDLALTWSFKPGGLVAVSGFPMGCSVAAVDALALVDRKSIPILACHGGKDPVASADLLVEKFLPLADCGFKWELIVYDDLGHHILKEKRLQEELCRFLCNHWNASEALFASRHAAESPKKQSFYSRVD